MNAATGEVNALHKVYLKCVDVQMKEYLKNPAVRGTTVEFCANEKDAYFTAMKDRFPHQYANVLRVEANTY